MFTPPESDGITLYGHSDDLVEIEGAVRDEISAIDKRVRVTFDTGTVADIAYSSDGIWKITIVHSAGDEVLDVCEEERDGRYTDYLVDLKATSITTEVSPC